MIDEREIVRRAVDRQTLPKPAFERLLQRRDRKRRNERFTAGVLAIAVFAGAMWFLAVQFSDRTPTPASRPPSPARSGSLAYGVDGDIYVADRNGSNPVRIVDGRPPSECSGHPEYWGEGSIWSPDGRYLAYRHADCATDDWHANAKVVISDPEGNLMTSIPTGVGWKISWSPDSSQVAVWDSVRDGTIGVYGLDGERKALLTVPPGTSGGDTDPVWLPDGQSLLVPNVVIPIDGSPPYRLPLADRRAAEVTHAPDGWIAYVPNSSVNRSLVVAQADGSNPQVVFGGWAWGPVWSPTGDRIAFTSAYDGGRGRSDQLRVLDLATGTVTTLAEFEADRLDELEVIDFSPEGDRILFSRTDWRTDAFSLWSVDADGSHLRRLVTGTSWGDWLSPAPTP